MESFSEVSAVTKTTSVTALAFVGFSGAGKTTVIEGLTKVLTAKGYKVGVVKLTVTPTMKAKTLGASRTLEPKFPL